MAMMESMNAAQQMLSEKSQRRASFSPMKAIRSLSISSQISHLSIGSDSDLSNAGVPRRTLRKSAPPGALKKESLIRKDSKSSTEDSVGRDSTSTRPTTPSVISRSTSIHGHVGSIIKSGPLQPEPSILKPKKEYLVLTTSTLLKFKCRAAAEHQFPNISAPEQGLAALSPIKSHTSLKDLSGTADTSIPLEKVVSVFKDEGTRPSFGLEIWWKSSNAAHTFASLELDFRLPDERDDWLKQIRQAVKARAKAIGEERAPSEIESDFTLILEAKHKHEKDTRVDIYPVVPRRPHTRLASEPKKNWRESSSFYLAFSKYSLFLAQFSQSSNGQKVNPSLVQYGLVTLSRVHLNVNDERFDLLFRLPLDKPQKLELSSRYYRTIISKLFKADTYLKPAWPLWTRREVFYMDDETQQMPLPNGEDYGGFKTTLEAFIEGYHCPPVEWTVKWKDMRHAPQFCLLKPRDQSQYTAHQLLAVFRAVRFNEFFKSLSFRDIDFSSLSNKFDNTHRLESTIWLSRTGKRSLTRSEVDMVEPSSVLFQELVAILLGSESIKYINLTNVLRNIPTVSSPQIDNPPSCAPIGVCEIMPPIVLLWRSLQTRCNSITLNGNAIGEIDAVELCRVFQSRPNFLKTFEISRCNIDEASFVYLWEGLHEQRCSLEELDTSYNPGRVEASRIACTLNEASRLKRLNLAYTIRGDLEGPLFRPWSSSAPFEAWHLEDLDLSGWKLNFDTLCGIMKYLELDESTGLRRLSLNNCGLTGELATGIFCRIGTGRDIHLFLNGNPLEAGSTDWIDLIHGNEAPTKLHLDMIQFQHESNFNRLLTALSHNKTIELLSMVGTGPPSRVSSKTSDILSKFFRTNNTLKFLDLSGYSGKLEDGHLGWGLSGALGGLKDNTSLHQLRLRNHDIGAADDLTELCRILAANKGLAMLDIGHNNFDHHQFGKLVQALSHNHQLISFPISEADREYAINKERRLLLKAQKQPIKPQDKLAKSIESRLDGVLAWLYGHWDSEAKKVKDILARNRDNPTNQALELESDYLEAWDDDDLPLWLAPKPTPQQDKGKRRASEASILTSFGDITPNASSSPVSLAGPQGPSLHRASGPPRKTYVIEEETSASDSDPHSNDDSPTSFEV
ncbi:RNI-like protein [Xylariaceae sp. AK1471]|nr:RNI-like protein [Xylariaceae sp. AK1471]